MNTQLIYQNCTFLFFKHQFVSHNCDLNLSSMLWYLRILLFLTWMHYNCPYGFTQILMFEYSTKWVLSYGSSLESKVIEVGVKYGDDWREILMKQLCAYDADELILETYNVNQNGILVLRKFCVEVGNSAAYSLSSYSRQNRKRTLRWCNTAIHYVCGVFRAHYIINYAVREFSLQAPLTFPSCLNCCATFMAKPPKLVSFLCQLPLHAARRAISSADINTQDYRSECIWICLQTVS